MKKIVALLGLLACTTPSFAKDNGQHGFSLLMPGGINYAYKGNKFQFSGGALGSDSFGAQVGLRLNVNRSKQWVSTNIVAGYSRTDNGCNYYCRTYDTWSYMGVTATIQFDSLFIEPGISIGSGDFSGPQLLLEAGILF